MRESEAHRSSGLIGYLKNPITGEMMMLAFPPGVYELRLEMQLISRTAPVYATISHGEPDPEYDVRIRLDTKSPDDVAADLERKTRALLRATVRQAPEAPAPEAPTPAPEALTPEAPAPEAPTPAPEAPTPAPEAPAPEAPAPEAPAHEAPTPAPEAPTPAPVPEAPGVPREQSVSPNKGSSKSKQK